MKRSNLLAMAVVLSATLFAFYLAAAPAQPPTNQLHVNISGYEVALGFPCTTSTVDNPKQCGVVFFGWTGGTGPFPLNPNPAESGWVPSPGTGGGSWTANINYEGAPGYGNKVTLLGGYFNLESTNGTAVSGVVTGGSVVWPASATTSVTSPYCGPGVARIDLQLSSVDPDPDAAPGPRAGSFTGCLLDQYPNVYNISLSAASPPPAWGTLIARVSELKPKP